MAALRLDSGGGGDAMTAGISALPQYSLAMLPVPLVNCPARRSLLNSKQGLTLRREKLSSRAKSRPSGIRVSSAISERNVQSGPRKSQKLSGTLKVQDKDNNVVFVAGATGKVGSRTVRELLKLGLQVRAGVRSVEKAQSIIGGSSASEDELSANSAPFFSPAKIFSFLAPPSKKEQQLQIVQCDIENPDDIETALGNAGVVICTVGASEKEVLDVTGPYRIDYQATKNLINAAKNAKVNHFVLLTSLGTTKFGWPAAVLNLFWGVLIWKAKAEKALTESGLVYTIVRPGGMERPTDAYKETHNLLLATKDTFTGGQVSRLQVAELLACIANNLELAENKVVEVIAETTAPLRDIEELLAEVPFQDKKQEEPETQKANQTADKRQRTEAFRGAEEKQNTAEAKKKAAEAKKKEELRQKLENELLTSKQKEKVATTEAEAIEKKRIELSQQAEAAAAAASGARALADALLVAAREGKLLSEEEKKKVLSLSRLDSKKDSKSSRMITSGARIEKTRKPTSTKNSSQDITASRQMKSEKTPMSEDINASGQMKLEKTPKSEDIKVKSEKNRKYTAAKDSTEKTPTETEPKKEVVAQEPSGDKDKLSSIKETVTALESSVTENARKEEAPKEEAKSDIEKVPKPFRWFWQRPAEKTTVPQDTFGVPTVSTPLSPYTRYADQKPPSSPTPKSPSSENNVQLVGIEKNNEKQLAPETSINTKPDEITENTLSPYTRYADQKPPSSPTPKPPSSENNVPPAGIEKNNEKQLASETSIKTKPDEITENTLSPYTRYSDLRPPTSPTPKLEKVALGPKEKPAKAETKVEGTAARNSAKSVPVKSNIDREFYSKQVREREKAALAKAKAAAVSLWPWQKPKAPESAGLRSNPPGAVLNEGPTSEQPPPTPVSRPLSPYTRYEELKPPASPTPSAPKLNQAEQIDTGKSEIPASSQPENDSAENGAGNVAQEAAQGLKWPWKR